MSQGVIGSQCDLGLIASQKVLQVVTPAKAGVQKTLSRLDSRLCGNDRKKHFSAFGQLVRIKRHGNRSSTLPDRQLRTVAQPLAYFEKTREEGKWRI